MSGPIFGDIEALGTPDLRECICGHCAEEHRCGVEECGAYYDRFDPASGHYQDDCYCKEFRPKKG